MFSFTASSLMVSGYLVVIAETNPLLDNSSASDFLALGVSSNPNRSSSIPRRAELPTCSSSSTMRERITFIQDRGVDLDVQQLRIAEGQLHVQDLLASREDQIIISFDELPQEVQSLRAWSIFYQSHQG